MPYCPECHAEYRDGIPSCASCGVELVVALPEVRRLGPSDDTVAIAMNRESSDPVEVDGRMVDPARIFLLEQAKELELSLQEAGYATLLRPLDELMFPDQRVRFEVHVLRSEYDRAQDLLDRRWREALEREGASLEQPADLEACPACGGKIPVNVAICPECELVVGVAEEPEA